MILPQQTAEVSFLKTTTIFSSDFNSSLLLKPVLLVAHFLSICMEANGGLRHECY